MKPSGYGYTPDRPAPGQPPESMMSSEKIDHPPHYGGADDPYEVIKVVEVWRLGFHLGNVIKYVARAGKKAGSDTVEDLKKARWYLDREINKAYLAVRDVRDQAALQDADLSWRASGSAIGPRASTSAQTPSISGNQRRQVGR